VSEPPPTPPPGASPTPPPTPPPRPTTKRGKPKKPKVQRRGFGTYFFGAIIVVAVLVAAWQIYESFTKSDEPAIGDHVHAALGINICGFPAENAPSFENRDGTDTRAGLHSHGDGLLHIHPFADDETGDEATVGRFMEYGGWEVDEDHLALWDDLAVNSGDPCPDGRPASIRWAVNGEEQDGNPADFKPEDQDVITIAFLPDGEPIPEPPAEVLEALPNPADVQQGG
jgi:hypothetical protein